MIFRLVAIVLTVASVIGLAGTPPANGQGRTYQSCSGSTDKTQRKELDVFCPRVEGAHPKGCCPPIYRTEQPLTCRYYVGSTKPASVESSYTVCEDNRNVVISCCGAGSRPCANNVINKPFFPRLINRDNQCCFESCPNAEYWRRPPNPDNSLSDRHLLGSGIPSCDEEINECAPNSPQCQPSSPCPEAPPGGPPRPPGPPEPTQPPPDPPPRGPPAPV
jgi:hypothetical protein